MKKIFVLFGIINLVLMGLFVAYYADALNGFLHLDIVNNGAIIDFVDNKFLPVIPSVIVKYYYVLWAVADPFGKLSATPRIYLFVSYVLTFVVAIVTLIKILDSNKKHYFSCILRLAFSPVTAVLGFVITGRSGREREAKRSRNDLVSSNKKVVSQPKASIEHVKLVMPHKPKYLIVINIIIALIVITIFSFLASYIMRMSRTHDFKLGIFIGVFIIVLMALFAISLPINIKFAYRSEYLKRCYKAIKEGTSLEDAKPIYDYFEKEVTFTEYENGVLKVEIDVKASRWKQADFEKKVFYYRDGILVDKDEAYRRTTTSTTYY